MLFLTAGMLVGAQFARYVNEERRIKDILVKRVSVRYWMSYFLTLTALFLLIYAGAKLDVFAASPVGWVGDLMPVVGSVLGLYPGYFIVSRESEL